MQKTILMAILSLLLCAPAYSLAAKPVKTRVEAIDVSNLELVVYKQQTEYFFLSCGSKEESRASGYDIINVGDSIKFKTGAMKAGLIDYIEYKDKTVINYGGKMFEREQGDTDCIIVSSEYQYPEAGKCENIWMLVNGCRLTGQ